MSPFKGDNMRVLFLIAVFVPLIFTVHAQRQFEQYTCQVSHKHSEVTFYINLSETREVEIGGWKILAGIRRLENFIEVSLQRTVDVMDATYQKHSIRTYPLDARRLPVELHHTFGGKTDVFGMVCYPRDP